jgi:hypothetical protein
MRLNFMLPLPRFVLHPATALVIAAVHVYLGVGHLSHLVAGQVEWVHIWKGFGALFGAYVFAALASHRTSARLKNAIPETNGGTGHTQGLYAEEE